MIPEITNWKLKELEQHIEIVINDWEEIVISTYWETMGFTDHPDHFFEVTRDFVVHSSFPIVLHPRYLNHTRLLKSLWPMEWTQEHLIRISRHVQTRSSWYTTQLKDSVCQTLVKLDLRLINPTVSTMHLCAGQDQNASQYTRAHFYPMLLYPYMLLPYVRCRV
jgi:hypothetical protein